MGLTAIAALSGGPGSALPPSPMLPRVPEMATAQASTPVTSSLRAHLREGWRPERPNEVSGVRASPTPSGPGRCSGRRAGNEIQAQLECSGDNSCFWDSVARCPAVAGGGGGGGLTLGPE